MLWRKEIENQPETWRAPWNPLSVKVRTSRSSWVIVTPANQAKAAVELLSDCGRRAGYHCGDSGIQSFWDPRPSSGR